MKYIIIAGIIVGALAGFSYWYYVGCYTGTCPITSNWHISSVYGGVMGGLLGSIGGEYIKKKGDKAGDETEG